MRAILVLLALTLGSALPAAALTLDLPVRRSGQGAAVPAPAYLGDVFEVRLVPATALVGAARTAGLARADALGVAGVDRLAAFLGGVWFEPEFRGASAPAEGSDEPDLTAFYVAHLPAGVALENALERFRALGEVASADPIAVLPVSTMPNDSLWTSSWWFYQPGTRHDIHAPEAWDVSTGDTAVVVAVLDTGVMPYHPDIGGRVAGLPGQIWTNWVEAAGVPSVDDDGNGFVDDVHGWDFVQIGLDALPGEDGGGEDNVPNDFAGHGTAVAGLIGALTDNGIGIAGTAWKVRIMPVRMGWASTFSPGGEVDMSYAAKAIAYAARMGVQVINCSWESDYLPGLEAAVTTAVHAGVTVVSAAGNNSPFHYLGDRDDVLAIAASDASDVVASFSNTGPWVDLTAPGVAMSSTWVAGGSQPAYASGLRGTSFAAPLVSGVAALVQARHVWPYAKHVLTPRGIQLRLMETADDIAAQNPLLVGQYGAGRLNAYRALTEVSGSTATRTKAGSVGAPLLLPSNADAHVAFLTTNRRVMQIDAVTQDTVMNQNANGTPTGDLAAADLGGAVGMALFYATTDAGVFGFAARNALPPGTWTWPQPRVAPPAMAGPALGDLDGDGAIEVVSGGDDGRLFAWHADGREAAGFPITTGASPLRAAPALSDLDGVPGVEVIIAAVDGTVHAYRTGGGELPGWPVVVGLNPRSPVVMHLGSSLSPTVVVAAANQLHAFPPEGTLGVERPGFPVTLGGPVSQDLAVGDMDGDGSDEIVITAFPPASIEVRDSSGLSLSALGWPRALGAAALGAPVLGELSTGSAGPEVLIMQGGGLLALARDTSPLATFPKPGGAGVSPSLGQADVDAAAEVLAGTGTDSLFYIYDAGPGSAGAGPMPWPTARGNFARTGSRLYAPALGRLDGVPPAPIADLRVTARADVSVSFAWTATGGDGVVGRPRAYDVRAALQPLDEAGFGAAPLQRVVSATVDAGGMETLVFGGLAAATRYWFALKAVDDADNPSLLSNVVATHTEVGGPLAGRSGAALAALSQPSRGSALFYWQASPDGVGGRQSIRIFDVTGRRLRVLDVGGGLGGKATWDGRDAEGRSVPAGLYYARLLSGSVHAQTRLVLLP
jgi:subtilisin family serine protease